ncbi:unnamed protein product [Heterobilharzia americana]|nr:unnamed protein product [Heterobilharzia americana]
MLALTTIWVPRFSLLRIPDYTLAYESYRCISKGFMRSRKAQKFNDNRDAAEVLENSLVGECIEKPVSALKKARLVEGHKHKFSVLFKKYSEYVQSSIFLND